MTGLGIDNLRVEVNGPELPIMDGSASAFVDAVGSAGVENQTQQKRFWVVTRTITVNIGDRRAQLRPASRFSIHCNIDFNHPVISAQSYQWEFNDHSFWRTLPAPALLVSCATSNS